jgi:hypothetical protein
VREDLGLITAGLVAVYLFVGVLLARQERDHAFA